MTKNWLKKQETLYTVNFRKQDPPIPKDTDLTISHLNNFSDYFIIIVMSCTKQIKIDKLVRSQQVDPCFSLEAYPIMARS